MRWTVVVMKEMSVADYGILWRVAIWSSDSTGTRDEEEEGRISGSNVTTVFIGVFGDFLGMGESL